jgi:hypothetical protein
MSCKCAGHVSVGDPNRTSRAGERCHVDRGQTVKAPMQIYAYFSLAGDDYACALIIGRRFESVVVGAAAAFFSRRGRRRRRPSPSASPTVVTTTCEKTGNFGGPCIAAGTQPDRLDRAHP